MIKAILKLIFLFPLVKTSNHQSDVFECFQNAHSKNKITPFILLLLFAIIPFESNTQIIVTSIDLKGNQNKIPIDSIISHPVHLLFLKVIQRIKTPKYFGDFEGRFISVYAMYGNKFIDKEMLRGGTHSSKGDKLVLKIQDKVFKEIKKYIILKEKTIYLIEIPIKFVLFNSSENGARDSIYLDKENLWGMSEIITISSIRRP